MRNQSLKTCRRSGVARTAESGEHWAQLEFSTFARYMLGREPPEKLVGRYVEASRIRFPSPPEGRDADLLRFAMRHPRLLPALDAACGFLRPRALLREKLLLATAILEASPDFADRFLPDKCGLWTLVSRIAACAFRTAVRLPVGGVLLALMSRGKQ